MDTGLRGRLVVVTGADSGIGLQTVVTLASEGATVLMSDKTDGPLQEARRMVEGEVPNARLHAVTADLTVPENVDRLRRSAEELGGASALAHLAGSRGAVGDFLELTDEQWQETLDIDLLGAVRVCRALIPGMLERGYGRIVLTASENAVRPSAEEMPYNASKAAIVNLGKALSKAYGARGVHTNVVSPAFVESPMTDAMIEQSARAQGLSFDQAVERFLQEERSGITVGRRGQPQEVAVVIAFLCSDLASFVDGSNWRVDSGSVESAFG